MSVVGAVWIKQRLTTEKEEMNQAKRMLREIRIGRMEVWALEDKREEIEARAIRATRPLTGTPGSSNHDKDLSDSVAGLLELDETLKQRIAEVSRKENEAIKLIARIRNARYRTLLTLYYIAGDQLATWEEVAGKMGYSFSTVTHAHGKALMELQRILDNQKCANNRK